MDVGPGGGRKQELRYKNHGSMDAHEKAVMHRAVGCVASGRATVFLISRAKQTRGLRSFPMGEVEEKGILMAYPPNSRRGRGR